MLRRRGAEGLRMVSVDGRSAPVVRVARAPIYQSAGIEDVGARAAFLGSAAAAIVFGGAQHSVG